MTRKHYELIAEAISLATDGGLKHLVNKDQLITALIPAFKRDNPNFNGFRFFDACYKHQAKNCPACGEKLNTDKALNALSRYAPSIEICGICATKEALTGKFWNK